MLVSDVLHCSLPSWYPTFEKVTIPSELLPLPAPVLDYLLEDGQLVLPAECNEEQRDGVEEDYEDYGEVDWSETGEQGPGLEQKSFPEFSGQVTEVLRRFGGQVFVKLNWSSPRDAGWIGFNNSLKVCSLAQLYLLLKSSDFITHDLTRPFEHCQDKDQGPMVEYSLVLRRWIDVNPGTEFRCFVRDREVVAICQRDNTNFYPHIVQQQDNIKQDILTFFREHIRDKFPLHSYVFDVLRSRKDKVLLVDFNPFGEPTDPIFFSWDELKEEREGQGSEQREAGLEQLEAGLEQLEIRLEEDETVSELPMQAPGQLQGSELQIQGSELPRQVSEKLDFRFATDSSGVQPHPYRHYSIPRDFVDLSTGSDPLKLIDFLNLKQRTENSETRQDEDSD